MKAALGTVPALRIPVLPGPQARKKLIGTQRQGFARAWKTATAGVPDAYRFTISAPRPFASEAEHADVAAKLQARAISAGGRVSGLDHGTVQRGQAKPALEPRS